MELPLKDMLLKCYRSDLFGVLGGNFRLWRWDLSFGDIKYVFKPFLVDTLINRTFFKEIIWYITFFHILHTINSAIYKAVLSSLIGPPKKNLLVPISYIYYDEYFPMTLIGPIGVPWGSINSKFLVYLCHASKFWELLS